MGPLHLGRLAFGILRRLRLRRLLLRRLRTLLLRTLLRLAARLRRTVLLLGVLLELVERKVPLLRLLLGSPVKLTVLVPGDSVDAVEISEVGLEAAHEAV